jgi:hypothetical protein
MTREEIRIECLKAIMPSMSKLDFSTDAIFEKAEKAYEYVTKAPSDTAKGQPQGPKAK